MHTHVHHAPQIEMPMSPQQFKCASTYSNTQQLRIWDNLKCKLTWEKQIVLWALFCVVGHSMDIWADFLGFLSVWKNDGNMFRRFSAETKRKHISRPNRCGKCFFPYFFPRKRGGKGWAFPPTLARKRFFRRLWRFPYFFPRKRDGKELCFPPSFRIRYKYSETTQIHKNANVNAITTICNLNLELNMLFKAQHNFIYTWWIMLVWGAHIQTKWPTTKHTWFRVT